MSKVLLLAKLTPQSGNQTTAERIRYFLSLLINQNQRKHCTIWSMFVVQCEPLCFFFLSYAANARAINEPQSNVPTTNIQLVSFLILLVIGEGRNELFSSLVNACMRVQQGVLKEIGFKSLLAPWWLRVLPMTSKIIERSIWITQFRNYASRSSEIMHHDGCSIIPLTYWDL